MKEQSGTNIENPIIQKVGFLLCKLAWLIRAKTAGDEQDKTRKDPGR